MKRCGPEPLNPKWTVRFLFRTGAAIFLFSYLFFCGSVFGEAGPAETAAEYSGVYLK